MAFHSVLGKFLHPGPGTALQFITILFVSLALSCFRLRAQQLKGAPKENEKSEKGEVIRGLPDGESAGLWASGLPSEGAE